MFRGPKTENLELRSFSKTSEISLLPVLILDELKTSDNLFEMSDYGLMSFYWCILICNV